MVYISKVYTRFGDKGETMLASGETVPKDSLRVRSYGEVDELNAVLGLTRTALRDVPAAALNFRDQVDAQLARISHELFNLGSELSTSNASSDETKVKIHQRHIDALEREIDELNEPLAPLTSFVLPGGGQAGSMAHLARTVCRRAEREVLALGRVEEVRSEACIYLNRLSDYFFVLARACAHALDEPEILWDSRNT